MKIALIPNVSKTDIVSYSFKLIEKLQALGMELFLYENLKKYFNQNKKLKFTTNLEEAVKKSDVVCAVGGDGSIIYAAKYAAIYDRPILGVNLGEVGFLAEIEPDEFQFLDLLVTKNYTIEKRILLEAFIQNPDSSSDSFLALNDITFFKEIPKDIINLQIRNHQNLIGNYRSDGLIVSTPTGSTAYSFSAGGAIALSDCDNIILTPICPHTFMNRSLIFNASSAELSIESKQNKNVLLSIDGNDSIHIDPNSVIKIKKSQHLSKFIKFKDRCFFDVLRDKILRI